MDPKQDPFFQHFSEFFSTFFECLCIHVNTITFANLSIVAAIIRQDRVLCTAKCRLNIFQQPPETSNPVEHACLIYLEYDCAELASIKMPDSMYFNGDNRFLTLNRVLTAPRKSARAADDASALVFHRAAAVRARPHLVGESDAYVGMGVLF